MSSDSEHNENILKSITSVENQNIDLNRDNENCSCTNMHLSDSSEKQSTAETVSDNQFDQTRENKNNFNINQSSIQESTDFVTPINLNEKFDEVETKCTIIDNEITKSTRIVDESLINNDSSKSSNEQSSNDVVDKIEFDDILGNKSLLKKTISPGTPNTRPIRNSLATVSYKLYLIDDSTSDSHLIETITNESFFIGECDILAAIDLSVQLMDRGEHALIESDVRHCYGNIGCKEKQIPQISSNKSYRMKIDLEFHDWKDGFDIQKLSIDERIYWSDKKRQRGNFFYHRKEYSNALQSYRGALKFLDTEENPLLEEETGSSSLIDRYIQVENNLAQVYLLNNQYDQCLDAVNQVLKHDSQNIKALFRQAKALFELGNYEQTIPSLKLLLESQNKDVDKDKVNEMLNICENKLAKYKKDEKEIYRRMFSSSSSSQSTTTLNQKLKKTNIKKIENKGNNTWWTYFAMGSAVLAAVGLAAIIKYR